MAEEFRRVKDADGRICVIYDEYTHPLGLFFGKAKDTVIEVREKPQTDFEIKRPKLEEVKKKKK